MNYRPITDFWILGRTKTKYYGAYPAGFLERARPMLLGGNPDGIIAHIPGGKAAEYNGKKGGITLSGFGPNDWTIDIRSECNPDICMDVANLTTLYEDFGLICYKDKSFLTPNAIIIDRPYTETDHEKYGLSKDTFPNLNKLLRDCLDLVKPGGFVGVIDFEWPQPGKDYKEVAAIGVSTGRSSRMRLFTVWRKR
jgi:hypothetical protein